MFYGSLFLIMDILEKRFNELNNRAYAHSYSTFSEFLNLDEQSTLNSMYLPCVLYGGYENAERVVAGFGEGVDKNDFPIVCIEIKPAIQKFADKLSHRDFLGALMNLGIKRELLGDIIICDNVGYLFCLEHIADYIVSGLDRVRHTTVKASRIDNPPVSATTPCEPDAIIVPSLRLDAIVSGVFRLSRSESARLFKAGKVFVNARLTESASYQVKDNDIVSVRGMGRFQYLCQLRNTKKDRIVISVIIYK